MRRALTAAACVCARALARTRRIDGTRLVKGNHFGVLEVEWEAEAGPRLLFSIRGEQGEVLTNLTVPLSELQADRAAREQAKPRFPPRRAPGYVH